MALGIAKVSAFDRNRNLATTLSQSVDANGQVTDPIFCSQNVGVQITGTATAISIQVERSAEVARGQQVWSPVSDPITGNPSTGLRVEGYIEPGAAMWRARVVSITGTATISISTGN